LRLNPKNIETSLKILKAYINSGKEKCPGCFVGGGPSQICGIAKCVREKGFWTCAECDDYNLNSDSPCSKSIPSPMPLGDPSQMMNLICKRYSKDTINNLKRCREIGYDAFVKEAKEKVANGWRTWQIISDEMVFTKSMQKK